MKSAYLNIKKNQYGLKVVYSVSDNAVANFKRYAPNVIERAMKIPALGFMEFLAETYSYLNQLEREYGYETKTSKFCFLFKYCSLSFLSFYY